MVSASDFSTELAPLWRAVHERLSSGRPVSRVRLGPLTGAQQEALADLLGLQRLPGDRPSVSLADLDQALGGDVRDVIVQLVGPIGDRAGDKQRARDEQSGLWTWLRTHPVVRAQPALADWVTAVRRSGLINRSVERTSNELDRALRVLERLPAEGVPLPIFADEVLNDPHGLDDDTRCAGLVRKALSVLYDLPPVTDAQERRALWERAGITADELSSTVLVAGLRTADSIVGRMLRVCADAGLVASLTLHQLRWAAPSHYGIDDVWVVENPSVLAVALTRFGDACPPIVCISGWPSAAGMLLLRGLTTAGVTLHYHGDFDGEGLRIAANVVARTGARPWRMTSADYLAAVSEGPPVGRVTAVPWDVELAGHLAHSNTTVSEERVVLTLIDDLAERYRLMPG